MNKGWGIGIVALVVAGLYWLQAVLVPLALAATWRAVERFR